jgi:FlaA1/EpsC-like NDP-sugar epimerase
LVLLQKPQLRSSRQKRERHGGPDYNFCKVPTDSFAPSDPLPSPDWESLLGRAASAHPVRISRLSGACVLVTGAGGFIGSEIVRVVAASGAAKIVLLDICEQHLFEIYAQMTGRGHGSRCAAVLGSVCDAALLDALFSEHRPEIVIHAAAHKHVPLMESNPIAAVATNALGTWILAEAAERHAARHMLLVSTDKAAAPASIMGAAKRIAELVMLAPSRTCRAALRLVNVIGSPGSVGPLFAAQIARGGPVTVTHPEARRWFLTLRETTALFVTAILRTGLFVAKPGEPVLIADLARRMIAASGRDVPIVFTAPRPGEKIDEVLLGPNEQLGSPVDLHSPFVSRNSWRVDSPVCEHLDTHLAALESAVAARDGVEMLRMVCELVPGYQPGALVQTSLQPHAEPAASLP